MTEAPTTLEHYRARALACDARIRAEGYYPGIWDRVRHPRPIEKIDNIEELLAPFQAMWDALPDSSSMRWGPFFDVCNLAEDYCFGEWREEQR